MIVIPMAGLSSRFFKAGFDKPKYMLDAHGKSLFEHAVSSFQHYFQSEHFLFIVRDVDNTVEFVNQRAQTLGIRSFSVKLLTQETRGQAETVFIGIEDQGDEKQSLTIFNIDTFRPGFVFPSQLADWDGYLEVFDGQGDNWSFVRPQSANTTRVIETAEKRPISQLCCTGLYYFASLQDYRDAYQHYLALPPEQWEKGELYVAPLYNYLIQQGKQIHYHLIERDKVIFCGVPDEYYAFLKQEPSAFKG
ncbi:MULTISPECIES: glycosyltransferase family 2 protein [unclassified Vibrio]|uniref:glycosyltransferase family 2 protein n=1 Tax=unclassified Vibrio TaxID=2614977 RepID=UPI0014829E1F|nr:MULTISPECIES: glycosyltransferase family 2 protein [unclassified Vibrio]NNN45419.1 capsular biosynthesis protein [Vibrio sp. 1-1(7)]NNN73297.1 capsular biosynthesis protein [Vibrio sp. 12-2(3-a)]